MSSVISPVKNFFKTTYIWVILIIILSVVLRILPGARTIDDSYITYRYVRNIITGVGFVYNPGYHVLGTTTPFYTLLLSGLGMIFIPRHLEQLPILAICINALADALTCFYLWKLGKLLGSERVGLITACLWAIAPFSVTFAIGGLETSVYVFWLVFTGYYYLRKRYVMGSLGAAMALMTRPDILIFLGPIAIIWFFQIVMKKEPVNWKEITIFLVPVLTWGLFATIYFGSPLPHSVQAKLITYKLGLYDGVIRLLQHYATPFLDENIGGKTAIMVGIVLYPFLFAIGSIRGMRDNWQSILIFAYPILYFIVFALANPLIFRWYLTPPLPFYYLGILMGAEKLLEDIFRNFQSRRWYKWSLIMVILGYPMFSMLSEWTFVPDHGNPLPAPRMAYIKLELFYAEVSQKIKEDVDFSKSCVIAAGDVGVLGFLTQANILDTVGLNSPESLQYYPIPDENYVINYTIPEDLILSQKPDYFVLLDVYGRKTILNSPDFPELYEQIVSIPTTIYGSEQMMVFKERNINCKK